MSTHKPESASKPSVDDKPMKIVSALSNVENTSVTVTWEAVNYGSGAQAYNVTITCVGHSKDNFLQSDLAATSLECPYVIEEGRTYQTFVVPINRGGQVNKWQSPMVPIPYPPVG